MLVDENCMTEIIKLNPCSFSLHYQYPQYWDTHMHDVPLGWTFTKATALHAFDFRHFPIYLWILALLLIWLSAINFSFLWILFREFFRNNLQKVILFSYFSIDLCVLFCKYLPFVSCLNKFYCQQHWYWYHSLKMLKYHRQKERDLCNVYRGCPFCIWYTYFCVRKPDIIGSHTSF